MHGKTLFITPAADSEIIAGIKKIASGIKLGPPEGWEHEITKYMYDKIPYITKYPTVITFDKRDDKLMAAKGNIEVKGSLLIPIIIKPKGMAAELQPLDIFKYEGKWYPLSKERVEQIMFTPSVGSMATKADMNGAVTSGDAMSNTTPPDMNISDRGYMKTGSIVEQALMTSTGKQRGAIVDVFAKNASWALKLKQNGTLGLIGKIKDYEEDAPSAIKLASKDGLGDVGIIKEANGYRLRMYGKGSVGLVEDGVVSATTVRRFFGDEVLKEASDKGVSFSMPRDRESDVYIKDDFCVGLGKIEKIGSYTVMDNKGQKMTGKVMKEIDFDGRLTGNKLFFNGEKFASEAVTIGTVAPIDTDGIIKSASMKGKFWGSFIADGAIATEPMEFTGTMCKVGGGVEVQAGAMSCVVTNDIKSLQKIGNKYFIPGSMKLVDIGRPTSLITDERRFVKNAQAVTVRDEEITVKYAGQNEYQFIGLTDGGFAEELDYTDSMLTLVKIGALPKEATLILKRAEKEKVTVGGVVTGLRTPKTMEKLAPNAKKVAVDLRTVVKLAAVIPDEKSVDAILGLGLVNDQNINVFRSFVPHFEEALSNLATLLVATRMGLDTLDEATIENAITMLDKVTSDLKDMFAAEDMARGIGGEAR